MKSSASCLKIRINTFSHLLTSQSKILSTLVILSTARIARNEIRHKADEIHKVDEICYSSGVDDE